MLKIGYLGFVNQHNVGDDLLEMSIVSLIKRHIPCKCKIVAARNHRDVSDYDLFICGGGTLLSPWDSGWMQTLWRVKEQKVPLVIFGTGVLPDFTDEAKASDRCSRERLADIIHSARLAAVRGPQSKRLLVDCGCAADEIDVIGDPALAFQSPSWYGLQGRLLYGRRRPLVAMSVGFSPNNAPSWRERAVESFAHLCTHLVETGCSVMFLPQRSKDIPFQREIMDALPSSRGRIYAPLRPLTVSQTFSAIGEADFVVAGKLHPGVIATIVNTPFVSYTYEPKCRDYAESIEYLQYTVDANCEDGALAACFASVCEDAPQIRSHLRQQTERYRERLTDFARRLPEALRQTVGASDVQCHVIDGE